ncbi:MAG: thioredoxin-like domain-containing protein, partial [Planctomycetota bacterium]|nr:thioredoxin-like domain-containing protein [Planctomycetota bacterium]
MIHVFTLALVLVMSSLAPGQSTARSFSQKKPTPEQLLEAWSEMTGWSVESTSGLVTTWSGYQNFGEPGTLKSVFAQDQPGCFLSEFSVPDRNPDRKYTSKIGSDGEIGWIYTTVDEQDLVEILSPHLLVLYELMLNPPSLLSLDQHVRKMVTTGKVKFADQPAWRVLCLPPDSRRSVELFFSVDNGYWLGGKTKDYLPTLFGAQKREVEVELTIQDYGYAGNAKLASKPGLGYPTHIILRHDGTISLDLRVEEFMIKDSIPKATFALPAAVKSKIAGKSSPRKARNEDTPAASTPQGDDHARLISMIGPQLVEASGQSVSSSVLAEKDNVLLYFSAKWCPPCRRFTPTLVKFFDQHAAKGDFTVILVSSDKSASEMLKYMKDYKMNFYAVPFDRINKSS